MNRPGSVRNRRTIYQGTCECCSEQFVTTYAYARFCTETCKSRFHYYAKQGRPVPPRRPRRPRLQEATPLPLAPVQVTLPIKAATPTTAVAGTPPGWDVREWNGTAIQRRADGFINATAMCQAGGKRLNDYTRLDRTIEYIEALRLALTAETHCGAAVAGFPATLSDVIEVNQGGLPHLQGTWIHPRLAVDLARWISPAFAVWMDGWFLEQMEPKREPPRRPIVIHAKSRRAAVTIWREAITHEVTAALKGHYEDDPCYLMDDRHYYRTAFDVVMP